MHENADMWELTSYFVRDDLSVQTVTQYCRQGADNLTRAWMESAGNDHLMCTYVGVTEIHHVWRRFTVGSET